MKVILFAGAEIRDYSFCESYMDGADAVICCDAGMRHAKALGIDPDYIVGDFGAGRDRPCSVRRYWGQI